MRLGIFGGTFDPIHLGHLRTAVEIGEELDLEKVCLIPSASPPHKLLGPAASFHDRMNMVKLGLGRSHLLELLDLEGRRAGPSYTVDTLREIHNMFEQDLELFFILGLDAFLDIKAWKEYRRLFDYANFVVIHREGTSNQVFEDLLFEMGADLRKRLPGDNAISMPSGKSLFLKETTRMEISSTMIREAVSAGKSISFLVPESVEQYIIEKGLY